MKIVHISATAVIEDEKIFGLGDDNKVYLWEPSQEEWFVYSNGAKKTATVAPKPRDNFFNPVVDGDPLATPF